MTPFEKNIEVWRQLWRVTEMSDIIVQIVDSRNPLLFWCKDLPDYTKELVARAERRGHMQQKRVLMLMNKADLLNETQRYRSCIAIERLIDRSLVLSRSIVLTLPCAIAVKHGSSTL